MGLNITVCIKSVIIGKAAGAFTRSADTTDLNPFDRPAVEMALMLLKHHPGTLTVLSMGPQSATRALYQAMAMGAGRGILISDPALRESDTFVTSRVLGTALKQLMPLDLILFGTRSADSDTGHVGPQTAEMLGLPFLINVHDLVKTEAGFHAGRRADGFEETFIITGPAAFSVNPTFKEPGHTGLGGIETTFKTKNIEIWNCDRLGLSPEQTGLGGSPTRVVSISGRKEKASCEFMEGPLDKKAVALAERLSRAGQLEQV